MIVTKIQNRFINYSFFFRKSCLVNCRPVDFGHEVILILPSVVRPVFIYYFIKLLESCTTRAPLEDLLIFTAPIISLLNVLILYYANFNGILKTKFTLRNICCPIARKLYAASGTAKVSRVV